ncbi:MAG: winged helix-turn-helix domain-containing protein [Myxococcota bacterium]
MNISIPGGMVDTEARTLVTADGMVPLREKEARLLEVLARASGEVVSREQLNTEVFEYGPNVLSRTLDTTVRRLRQKLEPVGAAAVVQTVYGGGYRFLPPSRPTRTRRIVGYESAERDLTDAISRPGAVVLTGPGGVGKTTLVREVLRDTADVCIVSCEVERVLEAVVLEAVGMEAAPHDAVGEALGLRPGLHLVLDDAEALPPEALARALRWVERCDTLHLLVVSRRRVHVDDVPVIELTGLAPEASRALFARLAGLPDGSALDGLLDTLQHHPLSIVLAARRVRTLGLEAFSLHLREHPEILSAEGMDERHRSLARVLDATLALLDAPARASITRIAVVDGSLDAPLLLAIVGSEGMEVVAALVDTHLLAREGASFALHPRTRAHLRRTGAPDELAEGADRYLRHVAGLVSSALPFAFALPSLDTLDRAARRAVQLQHPSAPLLQYGLCRSLNEAGDVLRSADGLQSLPPDDPHVALVHAHLTRETQPGSLEVVDRAVALTAHDDVLHLDALLQRASVRANHVDVPGTIADLEAFEALAAARGEDTLVWAWLWASVVARLNVTDFAKARLRWVEPHMARLPPTERLRWCWTFALVSVRCFEPERALSACDQAVELAEAEGSQLDLARSFIQRTPVRWGLGDLEGAREDIEATLVLSVGGPRWLQSSACNNVGALAMHLLDWERSREALSLGVLRSGASERSRLAAENQLACLDRELGHSTGQPVGAPVNHVGDHRWFLWPAQCGDLDASVELALGILREGGPLTRSRARALDAVAEVLVAAGRDEEALEALELLMPGLATGSSERAMMEPLRAVALRRTGQEVPARETSSSIPYSRLSADIWWCVLDALSGDTTARARLEALREEARHPMLTERSVLAWRLDAAESVMAASGSAPGAR